MKERRIRYMLPGELHEERAKLPLVFLPVAPLEWHGPHLPTGTDTLVAENVAIAVADRVGGVVMPVLCMGTERERPPEMLKSLGFKPDEYVVGMDFPEAKNIYPSFYCPEELFALVLREHIHQCILHDYRYIFIVNGHGAVNHNRVIERLCVEFSNFRPGIKTAFASAFPKKHIDEGLVGHADRDETSVIMHFDKDLVDTSRLPAAETPLPYTEYSVVDDGGFSGKPGPNHTVPPEFDPRISASEELGKAIFDKTVEELSEYVTETFEETGR